MTHPRYWARYVLSVVSSKCHLYSCLAIYRKLQPIIESVISIRIAFLAYYFQWSNPHEQFSVKSQAKYRYFHSRKWISKGHVNGLAQDCSNSIANAMELLHSCTKPSMCEITAFLFWPHWMWVRSRNCGCLVTWFCYQLIAKPGNKTAAVSWPDPCNGWPMDVMDLINIMAITLRNNLWLPPPAVLGKYI